MKPELTREDTFYDFGFRYNGPAQKAVENFNRKISLNYNFKRIGNLEYRAEVKGLFFIGFLLGCLFPRIVYKAEKNADNSTDININFQFPFLYRLTIHAILSLALFVIFLCVDFVNLYTVLLMVAMVAIFLYIFSYILLVDYIFAKKLESLLKHDGFTALWHRKSRKVLMAREYVVTALVGLLLLSLKGDYTILLEKDLVPDLFFILAFTPVIIWAIRKAYMAHKKSLQAKRYCSAVGLFGVSLPVILILFSPSINGALFGNAQIGESLIKDWDNGIITSSVLYEDDQKLKAFYDARADKLLCIFPIIPSLLLVLVLTFVFSIHFFLEQFGGQKSFHACEITAIFSKILDRNDKIDASVLEGSILDKLMIVYLFVLFSFITWVGLIFHVNFLLSFFFSFDFAFDSSGLLMAKLINIFAFVKGGNLGLKTLFIKTALASIFSLPVLVFLGMWLFSLYKHVFGYRKYKNIEADLAKFDSDVVKYAKIIGIEIVLDSRSELLTPYTIQRFLSNRKLIICSPLTISFFEKYPGYVVAVIAHEIGHFSNGHCLKIRLSELFSRFGMVSSGILSLLFNPLKMEKQADEYAKKYLKGNHLSPDLIKSAAWAFNAEQSDEDKFKPAAFNFFNSGVDNTKNDKDDLFLLKRLKVFYSFFFELTVYDYLYMPPKRR